MLMKELGECRMQDMKITRGWCTAGSQLLSEMCKQVSLLWKWNAFSNVSDSPLPTQHHSAELRRVQKSINTTHMRPCMPCCLAHPAPAPRRVSQANPAQGAATFERLPSVREAAQSPDFTQRAHGKVCLWSTTLPNCSSPQSFLLSPFPRIRSQTASSWGNRLSHRQPPATAQTQGGC